MSISWEINSIEIPKSLIQDFLDNHPDSSFFQSESFIELYRKNNFQPLNLVGILDNKVVAYCNVLVLKENYGILSNLTSRAIIWGGPLALDDSFFEKALIQLKKILKNQVIYLQIRNIFQLNDVRKELLSAQGIIYQEHFTVINQFSPNLLKTYLSKTRNKIRRAMKNDLIFKCLTEENEIELAGKLVIQTYKEIKLPCPNLDFFRNTSQLSKKGEIKVFGVFDNSKMISARFCLNWKNFMYDWYAGSDKLANHLYPNDLIVHKILEWGYENGYITFDFGGAGNNKAEYGVRDFKLKFGGELVEFGRNEIIFQSKKYKLGKLGFQLMKHLRK
jgi:lipid II:glycine glycyltransferase (peptidoglycan interpeptide bridge formation enzyme)